MATGKKGSLVVIDTKGIPWAEVFNDRIGRALLRKELFTDPDTGVLIRLVRYPAGVINPKHTHPCGHGMYVLEGNLVTHQGKFGPGTFVWFPKGLTHAEETTLNLDVEAKQTKSTGYSRIAQGPGEHKNQDAS